MDAHLSATLENTPEPEGTDIRRAPAGYLVRSGGVIVRAVEVHHMNIRSAGLRTPPRGLASPMAMSRVLEGNIRDRHQAPQVPQRIHSAGSIRRGPGCGRLPQELTTVGPHGRRQITISKRNSSGLSACRWLRALDLNQRSLKDLILTLGSLRIRSILSRRGLGTALSTPKNQFQDDPPASPITQRECSIPHGLYPLSYP
jgi:hypothetical protein